MPQLRVLSTIGTHNPWILERSCSQPYFGPRNLRLFMGSKGSNGLLIHVVLVYLVFENLLFFW